MFTRLKHISFYCRNLLKAFSRLLSEIKQSLNLEQKMVFKCKQVHLYFFDNPELKNESEFRKYLISPFNFPSAILR